MDLNLMQSSTNISTSEFMMQAAEDCWLGPVWISSGWIMFGSGSDRSRLG